MSNNEDFFDFIVLYELMFPDEPDKIIECPYCGEVIKGDAKVVCVDKIRRIFKCPNCDEEIEIE